MAELTQLLSEILDHAEADAQKIIEYATTMLAMRRRVRAALDMLENQRVEEAKEMLVQALADDGGFIRKRMDKIMKDVMDEYGSPGA